MALKPRAISGAADERGDWSAMLGQAIHLCAMAARVGEQLLPTGAEVFCAP
jgi:hypothetical protein